VTAVRTIALAAFLLTVTPALAADDYAVGNREWNGLSELAKIAGARGLSVVETERISWSEIGRGDVLFLVYPTARVEPSHLAAFLRGGGRALVGDDFGRADEALARLGLLRREAPRGQRAHEGNPNLPFAAPAMPEHPLARGVTELATNHPSAFSVSRGPDVVFAYRGGDAVVVAGQLGTPGKEGRFVALSDPSALINGMLAFDGNLTFAVNLLDFLATERPGRVVLVTGDASLSGEPVRPPDEDGQPLSANELLAELSLFLDELNDYLAPEELLRLLAASCGAIALLAGVFLPFRRARDPDARFARVGAAGEHPGLERLLAELDDDRRDASYAYPSALLKESAEAELEARVAAGGKDRPAAARALEALRRLPARGTVTGPERHVSRRDFVEAHAAVMAARRSR
jgi:hypothetical protein